ncbi:MAG: precorrin-8X methylmutase [Deltaproteobacteria bacterium]|nr:MAG: precorrin-8X methylmutase [Deltaproteobacteria bacterium]
MVEITKVDPSEIEPLSFKIIEEEAGDHGLKAEEWAVVRRLIHTTADFDFIKQTRFHPQAVAAGITAIRNGAAIVTDTRMAQAGITRKHLAPFGSEVHCFIDDSEVVTAARTENITRAAAAVSRARNLLHGGIAVIGNSPTALIELLRFYGQGKLQPALVVGMPVGFVNAVEAKKVLMASGLVHISVAGRKGGSAVAAATVNAIADLAAKQRKAHSA